MGAAIRSWICKIRPGFVGIQRPAVRGEKVLEQAQRLGHGSPRHAFAARDLSPRTSLPRCELEMPLDRMLQGSEPADQEACIRLHANVELAAARFATGTRQDARRASLP